MSLATGRTFKREMEYALRTVGIPSDIKKVVGGMFRFGCEHGSHHHILVGTITAIEVSDEGGVELFVSCPEMWSKPIKCIRHTSDGWAVCLDLPSDRVPERPSGKEIDGYVYPSNVFHGELELL